MNQYFISSAYNVLKNCLMVQENEELLVLADDKQDYRLVEAFTIAGNILGAQVGQVIYPAVKVQNNEPMRFVEAALKNVKAAVILPKVSITHVEAIRQARKDGTRVLLCSGLDERMLTGAVNADYTKLSELTDRFVKLFDGGEWVKVTCKKGTDVSFNIKGRLNAPIDGICNQPGQWNFAPAGTTATAPLEGTTNGTIVFDGSLAPLGVLKNDVRLEVKDGMITQISGGDQASEFETLLKSFHNPNVYNIAEIGIGTNDKAELCGKLIEDERIFGAFHVGIGKSLNIGGIVDAPFHTDGMILKPNVYLDGKLIVEDGNILI